MSASEGTSSQASQVGQNGQASHSGQPPVTAPATAGGKPETFRQSTALVIWWVWAVFAAANLVDIAIQGRDHFAAEVAAVLVLITGLAYVTAFRLRVLADDLSLQIRNPLRDHRISWGSVDSVDLGDSLQVHCSWPDGSGERKSKTMYGWAVHSPRRSRLKAEMRARRSERGRVRQPAAGYGRVPKEIQEAMGQTDAEHIVALLSQHSTRARAHGSVVGPPESRWHWLSVAVLLVPALVVTVLALV